MSLPWVDNFNWFPVILFSYGIECLFRFYSYGLESKFKENLFRDFEKETLKDFGKGELYGLEKFWAFLTYYDKASDIKVSPELQKVLENFKTLEDFKRVVSELMGIFLDYRLCMRIDSKC